MTIPRPARVRTGAFTLIELLTVIAIIAILAALTLGISGHVQETAGRKRAAGEIVAIEAALANYKVDYGDYPQGDGSENSTRNLLQELHPSDGKIYLEQIQAFEYKGDYNASNRLIDPFGRPYRYFYDPDSANGRNPITKSQNNGPVEPDIWSYGKDGESRNSSKPEKWITNWSSN